jgi:hypothetical protein
MIREDGGAKTALDLIQGHGEPQATLRGLDAIIARSAQEGLATDYRAALDALNGSGAVLGTLGSKTHVRAN